MGFVGVYRAIYDYVPKGEQELAITEGDLLYVLQKSTEDDWWKAKKKAPGEDDEEPVGLIPSNYIEEAVPSNHAKALYEYTRQTDEELSFAEDTPLIVYDTSDPDWSLVGFNGEYGFAPANYIELSNEQGPKSAPKSSKAHNDEAEARYGAQTSSSRSSPERTPAATLAGIMGSNSSSSHPETSSTSARRPTFTPDASDDEGASASPVLLSRPRATSSAPSSPGASPRGARLSSPPHNRAIYHGGDDEEAVRSPAGFHMYHVSEMVSALGKKKKLPTTLGINVANGTIMLAPEKARDGPQQEWTAEKLQHYSIEGKHVFLDLVRPSRSLDLHGGAKDTAQEIVAALGEIAGAARAEGLREVIAAGAGMGKALKKGQILYDFMAQGDDEVTVGVGDDVIIVDDTKSDEWWMVRRLKNGKEGVVPSSYVEITGITTLDGPTSMGGVNAVRSTTEQNRLEEERLTRETAARSKNHESSDRTHGVQPPERGSSLTAKPNDRRRPSTRGKRESKDDKANAPKSKPEAARMRTWTDRSNLFKVEAEYVGCTDGKIHLHKSNGVKIAVPVVKMSREDLEYVERISGMSLDEDKPLSDIKQRAQLRQAGPASQGPRSPTKPDTPRKDDFDWFDFFLKCGVAVQLCERYSSNFTRDSMDEAILPEITPSVLRTLGLKEGDILRVMKFLDNKYGKSGGDRAKRNVSFGGAEVMRDLADLESGETAGSNAAGGLFSGPGGTLHNNTRKGRPAPAIQTTDIVDPKAFEVTTDATRKARSEAEGTANQSQSQKTGRFEDNAWDVKPSKISTAASPLSAQTARSQPPTALTGAMQELSLLSPPLQPSIAHSQSPHKQPAPAQQNQISSGPLPQQQQQQQQQQSQPMGANPSFFQQLGPPQQQQSQIGMQPSGMIPQQTLFNHQQSFLNAASSRQRPAPPPQQQQPQNPGGLLLPPPSRPLSAPQNISQQSVFGPPPPLQAQLTGVHFPGGSSVVTRIAPPGQSLYEMSQSHLQPQFGPPQQLQPQMTGVYIPGLNSQTMGMMGQQAGGNGIFPQPTGFQHMSTQQQMLNGQQTGSPFANASGMQAQGTSFGQPQIQLSMQPTGINSRLPPALQPQPTGQPSPLLFGHGQSSHFVRPPPPIPQGPISGLQPLVPQQTGPAPSIRFGVSAEKKLVPQPTGKRANLSQATPQNPFGF